MAAGTAVAVKTKNGRIVRLYRRASARTYPNMAAAIRAMQAGPSETTTRVTDGYGTIIAAPQHREFRKRAGVKKRGNREDG